jgi:hypothetical protein
VKLLFHEAGNTCAHSLLRIVRKKCGLGWKEVRALRQAD